MVSKIVGRFALVFFAFTWLMITLVYCMILNFNQLYSLNIINDGLLAKAQNILTYFDLTTEFEFENSN
jgi:hypothetical protein